MSVADVVLLLGAIGVLITTITTAIIALRRVETVKEVVKDTKETLQKEVKDVHKIVNQQRTDMLSYQEKLIASLIAAGIHVPEDKSLKRSIVANPPPL